MRGRLKVITAAISRTLDCASRLLCSFLVLVSPHATPIWSYSLFKFAILSFKSLKYKKSQLSAHFTPTHAEGTNSSKSNLRFSTALIRNDC